jgi:succinate dehydrogenase / fumarate reductase flavoprotein subunit
VREGRGIDGRDFVHLDFRHLGREVLDTKLPDVTDFVRTYMGIDPATQPVPIQPTAHYAMGGIPTNNDAQVIADERGTPVEGLYAAGECACVSVHGANRLGTNSLVDILVYGRRAGRHIARHLRDCDPLRARENPTAAAWEPINSLLARSDGEPVAPIRETLQSEMMDNASVFRTASSLQHALEAVLTLQERFGRARLDDRGRRFNTDLVEALELSFLLDLAEATVASCQHRTESRGAHYREDYPNRDDENWLKHVLIYRRGPGQHDFRYKPVTITKYEPRERKY